jgi:hypothetical protein
VESVIVRTLSCRISSSDQSLNLGQLETLMSDRIFISILFHLFNANKVSDAFLLKGLFHESEKVKTA